MSDNNADNFMECSEALELVYNLAQQNALDPETCDSDLSEEAARQQTALKVVADLITNEYGED